MKFNIKYLLLSFVVLAISTVVYFFNDIVTYILLSWVVSMIGAPLVVFLRRYLGKNLAALITLSLFISAFLLLVWIFIPPLVNQIENISKVDYNKVVIALEEPIRDWEKWLVKKKLMLANVSDTVEVSKPKEFTQNDGINHTITLDSSYTNGDSLIPKTIVINIQMNDREVKPNTETRMEDDGSEDFFALLKENMNTYLNPEKIRLLFGNALYAFGDIMVGVFSIFFIGFFFLREQGLFIHILSAMVPVGYENQTKQAVEETSKLLIRYFVGILIQVTIITLIVSLSLTLIGVKNALLIGFFAGMMNVIPYIGPMIAAIVGVVITLSSNMELSFYTEMVPMITKVLLVFLITRIIDDILLQPKIFSKSVKAHPLEIFIIVLVGAKIAGIMGMVLAIPLYTAFRVIAKVFLSEFKVIQSLTKNM